MMGGSSYWHQYARCSECGAATSRACRDDDNKPTALCEGRSLRGPNGRRPAVAVLLDLKEEARTSRPLIKQLRSDLADRIEQVRNLQAKLEAAENKLLAIHALSNPKKETT